MRGSVRVFGNGGLFSITGRFWNRKLGWYRAYATDPSRAVVLRYPKRTVVITPHDPQHFIMRARDVHQGRGLSEVATSVRARGASASTTMPEAATNAASVHNAAA